MHIPVETAISEHDVSSGNGGEGFVGQAHVDLFGEIPPHVLERWATMCAVGGDGVRIAMEELRTQVISNGPLDLKTQQLVQFGQLLVLRDEGPARLHAKGAVRHGATLPELFGVAATAYLTSGVSGLSLGVKIIGEMLPK